MPRDRIAATFTGQPAGPFLEGLPARDLTADEVDALSEEQRTLLLANAASEHAVFTLHGRDLKAEAKEIATEAPDAPPEGALAASPPDPVSTAKSETKGAR